MPLKGWIQTFLVMYFIKSSFLLTKLYFTSKIFASRTLIDLVRLFAFDSLICIWLLVGNCLFLDSLNDCGSVPESKFINAFTSAVLIWGYVFFLMFVVQLIYVPWSVVRRCCSTRNSRLESISLHNDQSALSATLNILSCLTRMEFQPQLAFCDKQRVKCGVCAIRFERKDPVYQLGSCNDVFHCKCLEQRIREGKCSCPNCNVPLDSI